MYSGWITMHERCPRCGHQFERETGFFQGAMYVSWVTSVGLFATLAIMAMVGLAPRIGLNAALAVAVVAVHADRPHPVSLLARHLGAHQHRYPADA